MSQPPSRRLSASGPLFNLDTFRNSDFQVDQLISRLTEPILDPDRRQRPGSHVAGSGAKEAMAKCGRLLEQFERCGRDPMRADMRYCSRQLTHATLGHKPMLSS
jgi:hypothetical protein